MANISETNREERPRWLGHVERTVERCSNENMGDGSGWTLKDRKSKTWSDAIRKVMKERGVQREESRDRGTRTMKAQCSNPKYGKG